MTRPGVILALTAVMLIFVAGPARSQQGRVDLDYADIVELVPSKIEDTTYAVGSVVFTWGLGTIYCDSAIFVKGKSTRLLGNVILDDVDYRLVADSVFYDITANQATARGDYVELWSRQDSVFAVGRHAFLNRDTEYFRMNERPTLYLKYPDTANMVEVIADTIEYSSVEEKAAAVGDVSISSRDMSTQSGRAIMFPREDRLELYDKPVANRRQSQLTGESMLITSKNNVIHRIEVIDSARGEFKEPTDSTELFFDQSILRGRRLTLDFVDGNLDHVLCIGQAYSWYYPASKGRDQYDENSVSGDTIMFTVVDERLERVEVIGGAIGTYVTGKQVASDSTGVAVRDTIDYRSQYIRYDINDSLITLHRQAHVQSGTVELEAQRITLNTSSEIIEAYSAAVLPDTTSAPWELAAELEPNEIPVRLKDKEEEILADYLEYSIETEKGRIVQTKSDYAQGVYFGEKAYRSQRNIFYIRNGRYTPCDINYLHFYASQMKLIENDKLIAKPVVMYIGRLPILALPYYVFPLKKGRHSGFLPFTVGNLESGGSRYIDNVGYYWAASEYWDVQAAMSYRERNSAVGLSSQFRYNKRYAFDGYVKGDYAREISYVASSASESHSTRWTLSGRHTHTVSPSFKYSAKADYRSDATYYQDYSANLDDRLNRTTRSEVNFSKNFGKGYSVSGRLSQEENLDTKTRTTYLPTLNFSVPVIRPFGTGSRDEEGSLQTRWYNNITLTYRPSMTNYSSRIAVDSVINEVYVPVIDTLSGDTTWVLESSDLMEYRSRKKYTRIDHSVGLSFSTKLLKYITFQPSASYTENWYKIHQTDQSDAAGINASTTYRAYLYTARASMQTKLYGTVYPNVLGLAGLRQVISPRLSYTFTPEINRNPAIRSFAGGGSGSSSQKQELGVSIDHDYQAKMQLGARELKLDLVSISHSFSYDMEDDDRPFSDLSTRFQSNVLPKISLSGSMRHSFYHPTSGELDFWSPYLQDFQLNASVTLGGQTFIFDDTDSDMPRGVDSASDLSATAPRPSGGKGWQLSMSYSHRESGRGSSYTKSSFVRFTLGFALTPSTQVSYSQNYDFSRGKTINSQVSITRQLKCWTGHFFWVPIGSNRGYGFRLYVTNIPAIKIDNSQNPLSSGYFP